MSSPLRISTKETSSQVQRKRLQEIKELENLLLQKFNADPSENKLCRTLIKCLRRKSSDDQSELQVLAKALLVHLSGEKTDKIRNLLDTLSRSEANASSATAPSGS